MFPTTLKNVFMTCMEIDTNEWFSQIFGKAIFRKIQGPATNTDQWDYKLFLSQEDHLSNVVCTVS